MPSTRQRTRHARRRLRQAALFATAAVFAETPPQSEVRPMDKFTTLTGVAAPLRDHQCRHRHDHPEAVSEDDQAHRARQRAVRRDALQRRRLGEPGFRAQQAGLPQGADPGRRRQFRLRLVARACALGAARFRHPLRDLDQLRRHLLQQLLQERHPADQGLARGARS